MKKERTLEEILAEDNAPVARYQASLKNQVDVQTKSEMNAWVRRVLIGLFVVAVMAVVATNAGGIISGVGTSLLVVVSVAVYMLPAIIAKSRKHINTTPSC